MLIFESLSDTILSEHGGRNKFVTNLQAVHFPHPIPHLSGTHNLS
jgi:hypothetical protein